MIAIYARQSLDKKDSISIETQINFCLREITDSSEYRVFQDKGFSGKNISRPAFSQMMKAVEGREVTKIICYRLDRISRSITDFANIIDILEENKVGFVSANEKFDTSTPVGRAMLYIIMVFAQLERETIAERIKDNYYARGKTGVWLGGPAPIGYTNVKRIIDGKKMALLEPNADLEKVTKIYDLYANTSMSLGTIAKAMRQEYGQMWNNIKLSRILHNPAYVKADADIYYFFKHKKSIIVNEAEEFIGQKGCNLYGKRDRGANKYRHHEAHFLSLGHHDGIIDSQTWLKCQAKLDGNVQIKNTGKGKYTWLTGLVKCGYCGYGMNVKTYKNWKYFNCVGRYTTDLCKEKLETHKVDDVEKQVEEELRAYVLDTKGKEIKEGVHPELNSLKITLIDVESQIENLINSIASGNDILIDYANKKISELDEQKSQTLEEITRLSTASEPIGLPDMENWDDFSQEMKKAIAARLISKVLVYDNTIEVVWKL